MFERHAAIALLALAPAPAMAQVLPGDDHAALKKLIEDAPHFSRGGNQLRRIDQWLISSAGCQSFVRQRSAWSPRKPGGANMVVPAEIRWNAVSPMVAEGDAVRVRPHNVSGEFMLYAGDPVLARELALRMNRLRAACAKFTGPFRAWPPPGDGPAVPPSARFDLLSESSGYSSCRFVDMPELGLAGLRAPYEATINVPSAENAKVLASFTLSSEAAQGGAGGRVEVLISGYGYDPSRIPEGADFPVTATLDGRHVTTVLGGARSRSGFRVAPGSGDTLAFARRLFGGGSLVVTLYERNGIPRTRFTFDLPKGALTHLRAAGWKCS